MLKQNISQLDLISKRILVIAISISAVLLSTTLLIRTATPVTAQTTSNSVPPQGETYKAVTLNNGANAFIWNTRTGAWRWSFPHDNSIAGNSNQVNW